MKIRFLHLNLYFAISLLFLVNHFTYSQEINTTFGKNRVQYTDDFDSWSKYDTDHFTVFWYGKSKRVAQYVMQAAEHDFGEIQEIMEHRMNDKIQIIVYGDIGELYQTNIGLRSEELNTVGSYNLSGNRAFVYFNGNHKDLRVAIRKEITKVFLNNMLYGNTLSDMVQSSIKTDIPVWFKTGIVDYIGENWNESIGQDIRQVFYFDEKSTTSFKKFTKKYPDLAGYAFWHYIGMRYGHSAISNILYLSRINRTIENSFQYVLGQDFDSFSEDLMDYYRKIVNQDNENFEFLNTDKIIEKTSANIIFEKLTLSDDGEWLAYISNQNGRVKLFLKNKKTKRRKALKSFGYNNPLRPTDHTYPVLFWHDDNRTLGMIFEKNDELQLWLYDTETGEKLKNTLNPIFARVYSADFISNSEIVLSANINGYSQLFRYQLNTRVQEKLTDDRFDYLDVKIAEYQGKSGILYSSNMPLDTDDSFTNNTLINGKFDIFFRSIDEETSIRLTNNPHSNQRQPELSNNTLSYITDAFGVQAIEELNLTNGNKRNVILNSNILSKTCSDQICYFSIKQHRKSFLAKANLNETKVKATTYGKSIQDSQNDNQSPIEDINDLNHISDGWLFQSPYGDPPQLSYDLENNSPPTQEQDKIFQYDPTRATASRLRFKLIDINTTLDNQPLFSGLRSYISDQEGFKKIPLGLLFKAQITDLFEDYFLTGGLRLATDFSGYETFMTYENRKHQWDYTYGFYWKKNIRRQTGRLNITQKFQTNTVIGSFEAKYPFNEFLSIRFGSTLRNDATFAKIVDQNTYEDHPYQQAQRIGLKVSLILDNSSQRSINILRGSRAKIFLEGINKFKLAYEDKLVFDHSEAVMGILGMDARHYIPIFEKSVLALRVSGGTSVGTERLLYFMGDVEGSLFQKFDQSTPIPSDSEYAYRILTPQMRGFNTNIRNGTSYIVSNIELRIPLFRHIFSDYLRYDFLREFQLVGFLDAGTAWYGNSPYSDKNPINNTTVSNPVVTIDVTYYRDPLVIGYGWGMRSKLFGYFVKMDYGYGVDTKTILDPIIHISMGTDF